MSLSKKCKSWPRKVYLHLGLISDITRFDINSKSSRWGRNNGGYRRKGRQKDIVGAYWHLGELKKQFYQGRELLPRNSGKKG